MKTNPIQTVNIWIRLDLILKQNQLDEQIIKPKRLDQVIFPPKTEPIQSANTKY